MPQRIDRIKTGGPPCGKEAENYTYRGRKQKRKNIDSGFEDVRHLYDMSEDE
jgi:hypothetical protein